MLSNSPRKLVDKVEIHDWLHNTDNLKSDVKMAE